MTVRPQQSPSRLVVVGIALAAVAALAACSSPQTHFYTLGTEYSGTGRTEPVNPPFLIQVPAVGMPEDVARNQLVIHRNVERVDVLEEERWASPPADEIRRALSSALTHRLDTVDVTDLAYPPGVPVYRVSVNVQRFESWPGERAVIDAVWSVRSLASQAVMTCRTWVAEPVSLGYDALVAGHRKAVGYLAEQVTSGVRAMAAGRSRVTSAGQVSSAVPCPSAISAPMRDAP